MSNDVDLSDEQRRSLAAIRREVAPPSHLEDQVVSTLRSRGLIRGRTPMLGWVAAAAAIVVAFGAGAWSQRRSPVSVHPAQPRFVLLLYGGDADGSSRRAEYAAWARAQAQRGIDIDGEELAADQIELPNPAATGPTAQPRGFFIVGAQTMTEAKRVAESCPHLQHGGGIVIRPIVESRESGR